MTLTSRTMEWLNRNRNRSYPMSRDAWREKVSPESGLDCVLLDATLFDSDAVGDERLLLKSIEVAEETTFVRLAYGKTMFSVSLSGGTESGEGSFATLRGSVAGAGSRMASVSLVMSSHAYIHASVREGSWTIDRPVLESRVIRVSDGMGVDCVSVNGSEGVDGHESASEVSGEVVLEDGYRTSPIIYGGRVFVRVGRRYGLDPCKFDFRDASSRDCRRPLFFFCGQNAINNGNIALRGGKGVSVSQGRSYTVRDANSKCNGMTIPCVEIVAGRELIDICKPERTEETEDQSGASSPTS